MFDEKKIIIATSKSITFNLFLNDMSKALCKDYNIKILTSDPENIIFNSEKIKIKLPKNILSYFNIFSLLKTIINVNKTLYRFRDSYLFLHTPHISFFLRLFLFFNFKKTIYFVHGFRFHNRERKFKKNLFYILELILSYRTDFYITINKEDHKVVSNRFKRKGIKVNGIGLDEKKILKKKIINFNKNITIGVLCAYRKNKGYDTILKVARLLGEKFKIHCYGYDFNTKYCEFLKKNKSENLFLNNFTNDVYNKIDSFDLLLHLSEREGLPVSVMQALSRGVPVIGYSIRGLNDLICNEFNGYLLNIGDHKSIIKIIKKLDKNRNKLEMLSQNSINSINEKYTKNYVNDIVLSYFNKIHENRI